MSVGISEQTKELFRKYGIPEDISGHFLKMGPHHDLTGKPASARVVSRAVAP
jgi:hypothetical protein